MPWTFISYHGYSNFTIRICFLKTFELHDIPEFFFFNSWVRVPFSRLGMIAMGSSSGSYFVIGRFGSDSNFAILHWMIRHQVLISQSCLPFWFVYFDLYFLLGILASSGSGSASTLCVFHRYFILLLSWLCLTSISSNMLALNFTLICMGPAPSSSSSNGTATEWPRKVWRFSKFLYALKKTDSTSPHGLSQIGPKIF